MRCCRCLILARWHRVGTDRRIVVSQRQQGKVCCRDAPLSVPYTCTLAQSGTIEVWLLNDSMVKFAAEMRRCRCLILARWRRVGMDHKNDAGKYIQSAYLYKTYQFNYFVNLHVYEKYMFTSLFISSLLRYLSYWQKGLQHFLIFESYSRQKHFCY